MQPAERAAVLGVVVLAATVAAIARSHDGRPESWCLGTVQPDRSIRTDLCADHRIHGIDNAGVLPVVACDGSYLFVEGRIDGDRLEATDMTLAGPDKYDRWWSLRCWLREPFQ
ncbi:MAG TPA: hypothetical protein VLX92_33410 [Kofleriaceae bacterium]|nr:hypothetical protein [Kofleriaceae bacterium]